MGKYLDRLRARKFLDPLEDAVSKVSKASDSETLDTFDTDSLRESEKIAAYRAVLAEPTTWGGRTLPPTPSIQFAEPGHAAAWGAWWDTVGRLPGRGVKG